MTKQLPRIAAVLAPGDAETIARAFVEEPKLR